MVHYLGQILIKYFDEFARNYIYFITFLLRITFAFLQTIKKIIRLFRNLGDKNERRK